MNLFGLMAKASGIALLMGALLAAYAWTSLPEPRRSQVLGQAKWLVIPGYAGTAFWAVVFGLGILAGGCDPFFGGWSRTPTFLGFPSSEVLKCSEPAVQARVKPELEREYRRLPTLWSQVFLHYDEAVGLEPDSTRVWIFSLQRNALLHVPKERLEFRELPPRRGIIWWQPQEADEAW